ncbi:hypothetical protein HDV03_003836 [Kappamyces sp. JEL0829]|nr:hypothetical protein HDV03_003836 [Kappamyces sp. JEL0829]
MFLPLPSRNEFVAGGFAGAAQVLVGHPLDTIKVRLQLQNNTFKGPLDCAMTTLKQEGVRGLYKGMLAPLLGVAGINAVLFSAYGWGKSALGGDAGTLELSRIALAGGFAGFINSFVAAPIELLKIRLQAQRAGGIYSGPWDVFVKIVRTDGISNGLFRGLWVTICKEVPAYAGFYAGFEAMKRAQAEKGKELSVPQLMLAGSVGGMSYWTCCYPLDLIKSRVQQRSDVPSGVLQNVRTMYRQEGLRVFLRGYGISMLRSIPSAAATFTVYETVFKHLQ